MPGRRGDNRRPILMLATPIGSRVLPLAAMGV